MHAWSMVSFSWFVMHMFEITFGANLVYNFVVEMMNKIRINVENGHFTSLKSFCG